MEDYITGTGQKLKVHDRAVCQALRRGLKICAIHARADTHMKDWPTHWRSDWGGFMGVICPHGIGHPAPEETRSGGFGHGCDGCCTDPDRAQDIGAFRYRQGGMMRCCIKTLTEETKQIEAGAVRYTDGDRVSCYRCSSRLLLVEGVWEWDKSRANPTGTYVVPPEAELA